MRLALTDAGLRPEQIGYLNAHATSTEVGDTLEAQGIEDVFGEYAPRLPVSASKSMIGHLNGAAGPVGAGERRAGGGPGGLPPPPHAGRRAPPTAPRRVPPRT